MTAIVAIRPEPGLRATLALGREKGLTIHGAPLFETMAVRWSLPDVSGCDALLVGSANVFRHGGEQLAKLVHLPVHAVGQTTAHAAREAGFTVANVGSGGLQGLLDTLDQPLRFLRLSGAERVALVPPPPITILGQTVYQLETRPVGDALAPILAHGALVLLHSAAAARHLAAECDRLNLDRSAIALASLGPRIAAAAGDGWAVNESAPQPNDHALLALAAELV